MDRDFRDEKWTSRELEIQPGSNQARVDVPKPAAGFTAFLAEVELVHPPATAINCPPKSR
jgi:hypothetical protein